MTPGPVERWALDYITTTDLDQKRRPPPAPRAAPVSCLAPLRIPAPGRPPELVITRRAPKSPGPEAIRSPERRAALLHTFLHHELQAAELMCWAILAFPETPEAFRQGLLGIACDEIRHMALYEAHLATLGYAYGAFPVRDWFWERIPRVASPLGFVAALGMGLEGANLDHTARFAERFRAVGDEAGAVLQERVGREEIPHARFALHWFTRWTEPPVSLASWAARLPPPLSPLLMRGVPMNRQGRLDAGFSPAFLDELEAWAPAPGS